MSTDHDIGYGWTHKQEDGERETEVVRSLNTSVAEYVSAKDKSV